MEVIINVHIGSTIHYYRSVRGQLVVATTGFLGIRSIERIFPQHVSAHCPREVFHLLGKGALAPRRQPVWTFRSGR